MSTNDQGLSRHIPVEVKREVRQRSGFGCVVCRSAIYTYEHFDPPFSVARTHDPDGICLLCPNHQLETTKGLLPKDEVARAYRALQSLPVPERPRDVGFFTLYGDRPIVGLGSSIFDGFASIVAINGEDVLSYRVADEPPFVRFNGVFRDRDGRELFSIRENEWLGPVDAWDVEQVGTNLRIEDRPGHVFFEARKDASANCLSITRLDLFAPPFRVRLDPGQFELAQWSPRLSQWIRFRLAGFKAKGGISAIHLDSNAVPDPVPSGISLGSGVRIDGTGIVVGYGAGEMFISAMELHLVGGLRQIQPTVAKKGRRKK